MNIPYWLLGATLTLGLVGGFSHLENAQAAASKITDRPQIGKFNKVAEVVRDKCMACHTRNYDLPFYAQVPGIKQIIEQDYNDGLRAMDLNIELVDSAIHQPVGEPTLAKMEWVIQNNTMPPTKFAIVHWSSTLSNEEKADILDWVKMTRAEHYATGTAAKDKANEPVQPLPSIIATKPAKVALGEKLFNDVRLSGDDTVSCATCHDLKKGGTDAQRFSEGVRKQVGDINAPTVFNAAFNIRQFWNGRAADLQEQAGGPPFNPIEMDSKDWNQIVGKLAKDEVLTAEFKTVYPEGWTGNNITDAIAEYEKTLITPNSRFDLWLQGQNSAITATEVEGYRLFKAYRCSSCHVGKSLGGKSFEYMDLKKDYFADRGNPLGSDEGLRAFTKSDADFRRFKVPTLRNIELTAPYLHDGTVTSLDDAVRIMGVYLSGMPVAQGDRDKIVAFLRTLTGEFQGAKLTGQAVPR